MPTNRIVRLFWGDIEPTIDDDGFGVIDRNAHIAFTTDQCHALAIAIHDMTGWPIRGLGISGTYEDLNSPDHCVVYSPKHCVYVDIDGVHKSVGRIRRDYRVVKPHISRKQAHRLFGYKIPDVDAAIPFAKTILSDIQLQEGSIAK